MSNLFVKFRKKYIYSGGTEAPISLQILGDWPPHGILK